MQPAPGRRWQRTHISAAQTARMNEVFAKERHPSGAVKMELASELGLTPSAVQVWFQNRRSRSQKEPKAPCTDGGALPSGELFPELSGHDILVGNLLDECNELQPGAWIPAAASPSVASPLPAAAAPLPAAQPRQADVTTLAGATPAPTKTVSTAASMRVLRNLYVQGEAWKSGSAQWRVLSDARVKDVLADFTLGSGTLSRIAPRLFRYRGQPDHERPYVGVVAQELPPELVPFCRFRTRLPAPASLTTAATAAGEGDKDGTNSNASSGDCSNSSERGDEEAEGEVVVEVGEGEEGWQVEEATEEEEHGEVEDGLYLVDLSALPFVLLNAAVDLSARIDQTDALLRGLVERESSPSATAGCLTRGGGGGDDPSCWGGPWLPQLLAVTAPAGQHAPRARRDACGDGGGTSTTADADGVTIVAGATAPADADATDNDDDDAGKERDYAFGRLTLRFHDPTTRRAARLHNLRWRLAAFRLVVWLSLPLHTADFLLTMQKWGHFKDPHLTPNSLMTVGLVGVCVHYAMALLLSRRLGALHRAAVRHLDIFATVGVALIEWQVLRLLSAIDEVTRLRLTMFDAGLHTLVVEYGLSLWTHTISLLLPLMASHAGGSWSGLAALQLCACVVGVRTSFALGLGCPGGDVNDLWPPQDTCSSPNDGTICSAVGDLFDDIFGNSSSNTTTSDNATSPLYQLYEPRFSTATSLHELFENWHDFCFSFSKPACQRCELGASSTQLLELTYAVAPHAICLLLIYLVLRARLNNFIQVDTREREAVALRRALAVLEGKAAAPAAV